MNMTGRTILVTGGTSGIGQALAEAFLARGNRVIVAGRRQERLDAITASHPGLEAVRLDLDDEASVARLGAFLRDHAPALDVLVANAGISRAETMAAPGWTTADAEAVVRTNVFGVLRAVATALPILRRKPGATIMATTSNLAFIPRADFPAYCASKAFLHSWLQSLRHQLRGTGTEVLELAPPYVQTELTGQHQTVDPRAMPLSAYVAEVMGLLETGAHPRGEVLVARDLARRSAERDGTYDAMFAAINPA